jgi:hypothetical protein
MDYFGTSPVKKQEREMLAYQSTSTLACEHALEAHISHTIAV